MLQRFDRSFTQQAQLPVNSLRAADRVLKSAALHRYQSDANGLSEVSLAEAEFAAWQGSRYCIALASGGQAIQLALRAAGVQPGAPVLTNAFTLAPVPGAIRAVGGTPVLVEITEDLTIDLVDLEVKTRNSGAQILLLSHMRGHLPDMDAVQTIAAETGLTLVEDCAHTMGATWRGQKSGNFGAAGCFSTQTYKHMNSGEGGFMTTDDPTLAARAVIMSGSYMNYERHGAAPDPSHFEEVRYDWPNMSARMDNLRAAILRPQIEELDQAIDGWLKRYSILADALVAISPDVSLPVCPPAAVRVGSSIQFLAPSLTPNACRSLVIDLQLRGVEVQWFGDEEPKGFTSQHSHWHYLARQELPKTDRILKTLFDMRVPLSFSAEDCQKIGAILSDVLQTYVRGQAA